MATPAVAAATAVASAAASPAPSSLRPVVRTLYRALLRQAEQYGGIAHQSVQTVQHEIDRLLPTQPISSTGPKREALAISAIPIGTSAAPALAIAISPLPVLSAIHSTSSTIPSSSFSPTPSTPLSTLLLASLPSVTPTSRMTSPIAQSLVRSQFRQHQHETDPVQIHRLVSTAFTALRKLKDRQATLSFSVANHPVLGASSPASLSSSSSSGQSTVPHITPTLSTVQSMANPPSLHALRTSTTTTRPPYVSIHISTSHFRSIPAFRPAQGPSPASTATMHLFTYSISISNTHPTHSIQLLSRYWEFTASSGHRQEVTGEGVVGKQPVIAPGGVFQYTSNVNLHERQGQMQGKFVFRVLSQDKDADARQRRTASSRRSTSTRRRRLSKAFDDQRGSEDTGAAAAVQEADVTAETAVTTDAPPEPELFEAPVGPVLLATNEIHERH